MAIDCDLLKKLEFLRDVPPELASRLALQMIERSFAHREMVVHRVERAQSLSFLLEGRLQGVAFTQEGREVGLYFVEPGHCFSELSVFDSQQRPDDVIAVARSRVVFLPGVEARNLVFNSPGIAEKMLSRLSQRLHVTSAQRTLLSVQNPAQRVCAQLVQLTDTKISGKVSITNMPTHQEIAIMVNTSRETVTRVFRLLQTRGVVARMGATLQVDDPVYLKSMAEGEPVAA